jgi:hypothetical protein
MRRRGAVVVATGLLALGSGAAAGGAGHAGAATAAAVGPGGAPLPGPFTATPYLLPLDLRVRLTNRPPALPPATGPVVALPSDLRAAASAIPRVALAAYARAARGADAEHPGCDVPWQLVAAIGYVESGHARSGGSTSPRWSGVARPPILGPVLDGAPGIGAVLDTDHGRLDGDTVWDRAVGPMQFIPSTWARYAADADGDGTRDPQSVWDAAAATADYLCSAASSLDEPADEITAVFAYNHSFDYVRAVLTVAASYLGIDAALLGVEALPHDAVLTPSAQAQSPAPAPRPRPEATTTALGRPAPRPSPSATPTPVPGASATPSGTPAADPTVTPEPSTAPSTG